MENVQYTLVVTSCNRHDLLKRTLQSFVTYADIAPVKTIIVEDGPDTPDVSYFRGLGDIQVITNGKRKGQIYSVDRAYAEVKTEYIFHCEDDWEFKKTGFISESLEILEKHKNIFTVSLRTDWQHPIVSDPNFSFPIIQPNWDGGWGSFAFNPGLRRMSDYEKIGSYGKHVGYNPYEVGELYLSKLYATLGFSIASLEANPYVEHIGWGDRHVDWKVAPKPPKILIAILACHKYSMGQNEHELVRSNLRTNEVDVQMQACRDTWIKDIAPFSSYVDYKFFYGGDGGGKKPLPDEVFLEDCGDTYVDLPQKTRAICKWAVANDYDYLFKCDDDTYIYVDRLLACDFENYDYLGNVIGCLNYKYCGGGVGYWLSRAAMSIVAKQSKPSYPPIWAEDNWVGKVLTSAGIEPVNDNRFCTGGSDHWVNMDAIPPEVGHRFITFHACKPEHLHELHSRIIGPSFVPMDGLDSDEARMIVASLRLGDSNSVDLNKETKNRINGYIERLVKMVVEQKRRIAALEERLDNFNKKSSHKI